MSEELNFRVLATTNLDAVAGKKTSKCFPVGNRYSYRDGDFDNWFPSHQPNAGACVITTLEFSRDWTFAEAAAKVLGIGAGSSIKLLGEALIENGHTMTLRQAEKMVEAIERNKQTVMRNDGWANFFFVETGNENNPVSVGDVSRDGRAWNANVDRLDDDDRWYADNRLLVRNLDASKL